MGVFYFFYMKDSVLSELVPHYICLEEIAKKEGSIVYLNTYLILNSYEVRHTDTALLALAC